MDKVRVAGKVEEEEIEQGKFRIDSHASPF